MERNDILKSLEKDIRFYSDSIKELAFEILDNKVSEYPIFVAHQNIIELGEMILNSEDFDKDWSINASILEEFIEKGLVLKDKVSEFKKVYKDPKKNICIFLVTKELANFIFIPYKTKGKTSDPKNN
jgi:hypothetical protein